MVTLIDTDDAWQTFVADAHTQNLPCILMYSASWCGPCKRIFPVFESLAEQYPAAVRMAKVDVDGAVESARKQRIEAMPTFVVHYADGSTEHFMGADAQKLQSLVQRVCSNTASTPVDNNASQKQFTDEAPQPSAGSGLTRDVAEVTLVHSIARDADWDAFVTFVRNKRLPLVLAFGSAQDAACKRMESVFVEAARRYQGKCIFAHVDSDSARTVNQTFNLSGAIPYYCAYEANGQGRGQFAGALQSRFIGLVQNAIDM